MTRRENPDNSGIVPFDAQNAFLGNLPEEEVIAEITSKFGPIPEFEDAVSSTSYFQDGNPEEATFRYTYDRDQEHVQFLDITGRDDLSRGVEYVLLDPPSFTIARRSLHQAVDFRHINDAAHFRTMNFLQEMRVSGVLTDEVDRTTVQISYAKGFPSFRFGEGIPLVQLYCRSDEHYGERTNISLPVSPFQELQKKDSPSSLLDPQLKFYFYRSQNEPSVLYGGGIEIKVGKSVALKGLSRRISFDKKGDMVEIGMHIRKKGVQEEWRLSLPNFIDPVALDQAINGSFDEWRNLYQSMPVRLSILDANQLKHAKEASKQLSE